MQQTRNEGNRTGRVSVGSVLLRAVITAAVLLGTAYLTPGFSINGIWTLLASTVVILALDYAIEAFTGIDASPFGRGIVGFLTSVAVLYLTQFIVSGYSITILGSIIASVIIGIINAIIPQRTL